MTNPEPPQPKFHKDMTVGEATQAHPRAAEVFMSFHLGGCSHCGISFEETIGQVCEGYGIPVEQLLEALNGLPEEGGEPSAPESAPAPAASPTHQA